MGFRLDAILYSGPYNPAFCSPKTQNFFFYVRE